MYKKIHNFSLICTEKELKNKNDEPPLATRESGFYTFFDQNVNILPMHILLQHKIYKITSFVITLIGIYYSLQRKYLLHPAYTYFE